MNKIKKILAIMLIIYIIFNYLYSVNANEYTKEYLEALKENVDNSIDNAKVATDIVLQENLKGNSQRLESWIKDANTNGGKTEVLESEIKLIEENLKQAGIDGKILNNNQSGKQVTSTQNSSQSASNNQQISNNSQGTSEFGDTYYIPKNLKKVPGNLYKVEAKIDENGKIKGGKGGDQTGQEVRITPFSGGKRVYSVFRHPDPKVARAIAYYLGDASSNEYIGYNQDDRASFGIEVAKVNYEPMNLTTPCNTDCSAFVSAGIKFAFMKAGINKQVDIMTTSTLRSNLPGLGFTEVADIGRGTTAQLASTQKMQIGDIAVTISKGHTFVCMGDYYIANETPPLSSGAYGSGSLGGYTAEGEEVDDRQNIDEKKFRFSGLPGDVTYEGEINPIRNFFKKIGDFIDYLLGLLFMIIKVIIIGFTNIIYNIFLTITSFMKK